MEDVIDLRPYINILLRNAKWLIGISIILTIATFFIVRSFPKTYSAVASVIIVGDSNVFNFDPRIQSISDNEPLNALPEIAASNDILLELLKDSSLASTNIETLEDLRDSLNATTGSDRALLRLSAQTTDPVLSARVANRWAELVIQQANAIYGLQNDDQVLFFQEQLSQAEATLQTAETNLIQFQEINRTSVISNTLSFYNKEQADLLANQQIINRLLQDSENLQNQVNSSPDNNPATFTDQLTALNMQLEAYEANTGPIILQLDSSMTLIGSTQNEQATFLEGFNEQLQAKLSIVEARLTTLEPEILTLQKAWQEAVIEKQRLERNRLVAEETYLSLARKAQEEQIIAQDTQSGLRLLSRASEPTEAESRRTLLATVLAGAAGFALSALYVLAKAWWQQ